MKQPIKTLLIALLPLVVGLIVGFVMSPKTNKTYEQALEKENKTYLSRIKELQTEQQYVVNELTDAMKSVELSRDSVKIAHAKTEIWKKKYESSKNARVNVSSQSQLDSLLSTLYPVRQH